MMNGTVNLHPTAADVSHHIVDADKCGWIDFGCPYEGLIIQLCVKNDPAIADAIAWHAAQLASAMRKLSSKTEAA